MWFVYYYYYHFHNNGTIGFLPAFSLFFSLRILPAIIGNNKPIENRMNWNEIDILISDHIISFIRFHLVSFNEWFDLKSHLHFSTITKRCCDSFDFEVNYNGDVSSFFFFWFCDIWWLYFRFSKLKGEFRDEWIWWPHFHFELE